MAFFFFFVFYTLRAAPTSYGVSQARGLIGAVAAGLHRVTAMPDASCVGNLHNSSQQCWILNPLSEAKDQTHILMDTSWVLNPLSHDRNSFLIIFESKK